MAGDKFSGIDIKWDYVNKRCRISMPGYIENLLIKFKHPSHATVGSLPMHACPSPMVQSPSLLPKKTIRNSLMLLVNSGSKKS